MADKIVRYTRKLSGEEALERYIMILQDQMQLFPKAGVPFKLKIGTKEYDSQIKAVDCWCRGPQKPHVHYRIDIAPFYESFRPHFGQVISLEKEKDGRYILK